jgi:hypothetical protein
VDFGNGGCMPIMVANKIVAPSMAKLLPIL